MPAAHSPPMPMPNSARKANSIAYEVENPLRQAKIENHTIDSISGSLRPYLSASVPAAAPPTSRMISVTVPSAPASARSTVKLFWMSIRMKVMMLKSNAVDDPPEEHRPEGAPLIARDLPVPGDAPACRGSVVEGADVAGVLTVTSLDGECEAYHGAAEHGPGSANRCTTGAPLGGTVKAEAGIDPASWSSALSHCPWFRRGSGIDESRRQVRADHRIHPGPRPRRGGAVCRRRLPHRAERLRVVGGGRGDPRRGIEDRHRVRTLYSGADLREPDRDHAR